MQEKENKVTSIFQVILQFTNKTDSMHISSAQLNIY